MTHYYLYIHAGLQIDATTTFYKVGVGESEAQTKKKAWLQAYANEHGHFFVRWSLDAMDFLDRCLESIGTPNGRVIAITANDLIKVFRTGSEEPASYQSEMNRHHLLMQIDPDYYCSQVIRNRRYLPKSRECCSK